MSYVAANLRQEDFEEADCQFDTWSPAHLAMACLRDHSYVVEVKGNPEAAVGASRATHSGLWVAWSWGTRRMWRTVPKITAFVRDVMIPDIIEQGGWRCEARALASHTGAHLWLKRMGATECCDLPGWGKGGETFKLFSWVRADVLQSTIDIRQPETAIGSAAAGDADD